MSETCDRREFARRAVLSSLALGAGTAHAEDSQPADDSASSEEKLKSREDLLIDVIRQQYPSEHLTSDVLTQIRRDIAGHQYRSQVLKSVPLTNGEAPFVFSAIVAKSVAEE
ncbi:MAG: hypothetical protein P8M30_06795 [Planctomycetaceae bacterium]|jgi:hypothetical protein|nr:hypothetical protein [Planctomycetaceae bacterium]MDC0273415.1 hypothetical protein [Planctomycetaceae bacterium]MDG2389010.1 hypothetical protein [Planctomycetaceae bacterium]